ncbi:alpha-1,4-glucan branching enzyme, partial [Haplosporangium bisporale]
AFVSLKHESDKVLAFDRAGAVFIFNFHATNSFTDYRIAVPEPGKYRILLNSDEARFGGHDRVKLDGEFFSTPAP